MFNTRILKFGLIAVIASVLSTAEARPKKDKEKPEKPHPEKKIDREKIKERLKAAFDKRKKRRGDAKKRGHKVRGHKGGHAFGKLIRDDAKIKELREAFKKATEKMKGGFDKSKWKDATDEEKAALRDKLKASRKDWADAMKAHHKEVHARIKEIREEFKNNRDKVIDGNEPGE